jgi:stage II sporulation protein R
MIAGGFLLMKLKKWELALIIALVITFLCGATLTKEQSALSDKLIRLHVIANSDSEEDQKLKLEVRDKILETVSVLLEGVTDRGEAVELLKNDMEKIITAAEAEVRARGYDYSVAAEIGLEAYPTREYETFSLPAGDYVSLRVLIGDAAGRNWWCVIFPPLCVSAASGMDEEALSTLSDEEVALITSDSPEYVVKFKAIELVGKLKGWLGI